MKHSGCSSLETRKTATIIIMAAFSLVITKAAVTIIKIFIATTASSNSNHLVVENTTVSILIITIDNINNLIQRVKAWVIDPL
jgi:hypothetical protein